MILLKESFIYQLWLWLLAAYEASTVHRCLTACGDKSTSTDTPNTDSSADTAANTDSSASDTASDQCLCHITTDASYTKYGYPFFLKFFYCFLSQQ